MSSVGCCTWPRIYNPRRSGTRPYPSAIKVDSSGVKVSLAMVLRISLAAARVGYPSPILPVLVKRFEQFAQAKRAGESRQLAHFAIIHVLTSRTARALFVTYLRLSYEWLPKPGVITTRIPNPFVLSR
jgi:hypothetical protein